MTKWRITEITHYPGTKKESKEYLVEKRFLGFLWWYDPFDDGMYTSLVKMVVGVNSLGQQQKKRLRDFVKMDLTLIKFGNLGNIGLLNGGINYEKRM